MAGPVRHGLVRHKHKRHVFFYRFPFLSASFPVSCSFARLFPDDFTPSLITAGGRTGYQTKNVKRTMTMPPNFGVLVAFAHFDKTATINADAVDRHRRQLCVWHEEKVTAVIEQKRSKSKCTKTRPKNQMTTAAGHSNAATPATVRAATRKNNHQNVFVVSSTPIITIIIAIITANLPPPLLLAVLSQVDQLQQKRIISKERRRSSTPSADLCSLILVAISLLPDPQGQQHRLVIFVESSSCYYYYHEYIRLL